MNNGLLPKVYIHNTITTIQPLYIPLLEYHVYPFTYNLEKTKSLHSTTYQHFISRRHKLLVLKNICHKEPVHRDAIDLQLSTRDVTALFVHLTGSKRLIYRCAYKNPNPTDMARHSRKRGGMNWIYTTRSNHKIKIYERINIFFIFIPNKKFGLNIQKHTL